MEYDSHIIRYYTKCRRETYYTKIFCDLDTCMDSLIIEDESILDDLTTCPFNDCGWCYAKHLVEYGCISLRTCKIEHKNEWIEYINNPSNK